MFFLSTFQAENRLVLHKNESAIFVEWDRDLYLTGYFSPWIFINLNIKEKFTIIVE